MIKNNLTYQVIGAAIEVQKELGLGLLEQTYEICLFRLLNRRGLNTLRQVSCPIIFDGEILDNAYRIDILVNNELIIEIKAVEKLKPVHEAQVLTYMKFAKKPLGLLINFNCTPIKNGIRRFVMKENILR